MVINMRQLPPPPPDTPERSEDIFACHNWKVCSVNSVAQLCLTLCNPMDCNMPGFTVHHLFFFFVLSCMNCFHDLEIISWPSSTPEDCSNSCPLSRWCHLSNQLILCRPFLLGFPFFPTSGSFAISQFFASRGQSIGASASVLSRNIQDWFPLGWTGWILPSKGLSRVFSNTTVQKHQFFSTQLSL